MNIQFIEIPKVVFYSTIENKFYIYVNGKIFISNKKASQLLREGYQMALAEKE